MSQTMVSGFVDPGFVNRQRAKANSNIGSGNDLNDSEVYTSIANLDTRLAAIDGTYYTQARLDQMSVNDKVYAVRVSDDPTTI